MSHRKNSRQVAVLLSVITVFTARGLASVSLAQDNSARPATAAKKIPLVGRVLADVERLPFGAGVGPEWTTFVFAVEDQERKSLSPVKIAYAFFKDQGPPPDSFFDYSIRYELQVARTPDCDESVASLSYVKNVTEAGKELPPTYALRFMNGAPKDILRPEAILPCYTLYAGDLKVVSKDNGSRQESKPPKANAVPAPH